VLQLPADARDASQDRTSPASQAEVEVIRYLLEQVPERGVDLKPGEVLPVFHSRKERCLLWLETMGLHEFVSVWDEWGDVARRPLYFHDGPWLGYVHDDGLSLMPITAIQQPDEPMPPIPDVKNVTIPELARTTSRAAFALTFPVLALAALAGVAAGICVTVYRHTIQLFP
jgi:hypothetical protein